MMKIVVDSFAWFELFRGSASGEKVAEFIEKHEGRIYTTTANFYEIYYRITQEKDELKREEALAYIKNVSKLVDIDEEISRVAGQIRVKEGLSAIDSFTLAAARILDAKVLTGDIHFKKFPKEIIFI